MKMKHSKRSLKELHMHLSNLPLELAHEIYKYVLVAKNPIDLVHSGGTNLVHKWHELMDQETRDCEIALQLLVYGPLAVNGHDAYAFLFRSNTFRIRTRRVSELLMISIQELCDVGYPAYLKGLIVDVLPDADDAGFLIEPKDYDKNDNRDPESRAFRILETLLPLRRLDTLHVLITNDRKGGETYFIGGSRNPSIEKITAVLSRLRSLIFSTSKAPDFKVIMQKDYGLTNTSEEGRVLNEVPLQACDITWFWHLPSPNKMEIVECWTLMGKILNWNSARTRSPLSVLMKTKRLEPNSASESTTAIEAATQESRS